MWPESPVVRFTLVQILGIVRSRLRAGMAHCAAVAGLAVALTADNIGRKRASRRRGWVEKSGQPEESPRVQRGALS